MFVVTMVGLHSRRADFSDGHYRSLEHGIRKNGVCNRCPYGQWETDFLPLLVLTRRGRSTGKNQYW